jgi:hypothetical protein
MPANYKSGNKAFDDQAASLEAARQVSSPVGATQSTVMAADIVYYRGMVKNAIAQGLSPSLYNQALKALGPNT